MTKYNGKAASFAPGSGVAASGAVLGRAAAMLGSSVSMPAFGARSLAAALAIAVPLALAGPAHAQIIPPNAPCNVVTNGGTTITCTGNVGAGVDLNVIGGLYTTLNVNTLTQDIAPAAGIDGINFTSGGDVTITSDTGIFAITTTGNNAEGINAYSANGNITITQTGNITTMGNSADGIDAEINDDGNITVIQTGTITTMGNNAEGIVADARIGNITVIHTGTITTQGTGAEGIYAENSSIGAGTVDITTNSTIVAANAAAIRVDNGGTGATTITTAGVVSGTTGIDILNRFSNAPTTINNSGVITGTGGVAINFGGEGNDTLNILPGSVITGTIDFGNGNANDVDTLNVGLGVNAVFTFADASGGDSALLSAPENTTGNVVFVNGGTQAVAVDPTGFAAAGAAVGGLTTGIFNAIDNSGSGPQGTAPLTGGIAPAGGNAKSVYGSNRRLWVSGFGGKQKVDGSSSQVGIKNNFGGVITGVETSLGGKGSYGVFGGYARSKIDIEFGASDVETDSVFGGAYWKIDMGTFRVQLALVAGSADQDTTRNVGGVTARGETDGWFFSPSITLAAPIEGLSFPLIASGRLSYTGLFLDGYTETGGILPLTVGDRDVGVFSTRAQLTLPQLINNKDGSTTRVDWRAGIDAQFDAGSDNVSLTVAATPFSFSADLDNQVAGFIGSSVTYTSQNGLYNLSASGEIQSTFDGGYKAIGQLRAAVNF